MFNLCFLTASMLDKRGGGGLGGGEDKESNDEALLFNILFSVPIKDKREEGVVGGGGNAILC